MRRFAFGSLLALAVSVFACSGSDGSSSGGTQDGGDDAPASGPGFRYLVSSGYDELKNPTAFYVTPTFGGAYSANTTYIQGSSPGGSYALTLTVPGSSAGTFSCGAGGAYVGYAPDPPPTCTPTNCPGPSGWSAGGGTGSCSITITGYGAVGEHIVGTFTANGVTASLPGKTGDPVATNGSFDLIRAPDVK